MKPFDWTKPCWPRTARLLVLPLVALALGGCAAQMAFRDGNALVAQDKLEAGLLKYREAIEADPGNAIYKSTYLQTRDRNATRMLERGERYLAAGNSAMALQEYGRVLAIDPSNERARGGLRNIEVEERHRRILVQAESALAKKDVDTARTRIAEILTERPQHEAARQLQSRIEAEAAVAPTADTALSSAYRQPITIEFRNAPLRQIFDVIARRSGLNFLFDKDVKTDTKASIFLKNSTVEAAVYYLLVTNQLEKQVMDGNTLLVYPNLPAKLKEYQEMSVKTFYLANAEAKTVANTLKSILKSRDVAVDEKLNLVIMRDSPEAIKVATRLVALQDVAEPEVMLDVEILEIKRSRIMELGIAWPESLSLAPLSTLAGGPLTLETLSSLRRRDIGVGGLSATINANKTDGDSNLLANPRIRVRNKEKAKVMIGDKIPNITTTVSSAAAGGFAFESVNYIDVGLTLNVEPTIYLNDEVAIRISLEVSNLVNSMTTKSGTTAYQIGSRQASTMLQLKDGETQVLAGLINSEDRSSGSKLPGLGNLPIVGRLFGSTRDDKEKTEIVLSITPHLVRSVQRPSASASEFSAGTEGSFRRRPDAAPVATVAIPVNAPRPAAPAPVVIPGSIPSAPPPAAPASVQPGTTATQDDGAPPGVPPAAVPQPGVPIGTVAPSPGTQITPIPAPRTSPAQQQ